MKLVLDSNVALKTVLPEVDSGRAILLIADYKQGLHELLAPDFFPVEVGHALTRAERQKRIQPPDGWRFWNSIMADAPALLPHLPVTATPFRCKQFDPPSTRRSPTTSGGTCRLPGGL